MGQANHNPRSPQFKGPLPDFQLKSAGNIRVEPNAAAMERIKAAKEAADAAGAEMIPPRLKDTDLDVVAMAQVAFIVPMKLVNEHPAAMVNLGEIRIPLIDLKTQARKMFRENGHLAVEGLIKFDDDGIAEA
jgi:hypothetical protein